MKATACLVSDLFIQFNMYNLQATQLLPELFLELNEQIARIVSAFTFPLTEQQSKAITQLWQFLNSDESLFLLAGYAGTGKSTIIFAIVNELIRQNKKVVLTAPTNKAVAVLKKMAAKSGVVEVNCTTIHQLLGLGIVNKGTEKKLQPVTASSIHLYDVIFLDECSMVGTELWQCIEPYFSNSLLFNRKLVLMGDPAQLNPVGDKRSPTFKVKNRAILTNVVRQARQSPLFDFVNASRSAIKNRAEAFKPFASYDRDNKSNGAFPVKEASLLKYAIAKIDKEFRDNPDCFRLLGYTNKQVDRYNQIIRQAIYGQDASQFIEGERLITKKPVVAPDGKTVILPTSYEITVIEVQQAKYWGYQVHQLKVATDEGESRQIFILHESEQSRYQTELKRLHQKAKQTPFLWHKYYQFRDDLFAEVTNCFSITVHNSQGSTFEEGAINSNDLTTRLFVGEESRRQKLKEYHRLWYVAASRMKNRLLFTCLDRSSG
jgi:exodeoxyribonuclease-5